MATISSDGCHCVTKVVGQTFKFCFITEKQHPVFLISQHVLPETGAKTCQFFADFSQAFLTGLIQLCTGFDKRLADPFEQPDLFIVQAQSFAVLVNGINAFKQRFVHGNFRVMPRHLRRDHAFQSLDRLVGIRASLVPEQR